MNINQYLQDFAGTWPCVGLILIREDMAKCILDNLNGGTSKKGELCPPLKGLVLATFCTVGEANWPPECLDALIPFNIVVVQ